MRLPGMERKVERKRRIQPGPPHTVILPDGGFAKLLVQSSGVSLKIFMQNILEETSGSAQCGKIGKLVEAD